MKYSKYLLTVIFSFLVSDAYSVERPAPIFLWPEGAPGSVERMNEPEKEDIGPGKCNVSNVHHPSITPYLVDAKEKSSSNPTPAILVCPGGGHRVLCLGHEGFDLGEWFATQGISAFILKNRLAREEGSKYTVDDHAMADTRRALRLIRSRAKEWNLDPAKLGVLGFSAGGELAAMAAMESDNGKPNAADDVERYGCRPDYQVLIYPGSSSRFTVQKGMPPVFIALGAKDRDDIALGMPKLYLKYKEAGVPAELHIYSNAGHGFGFRKDSQTAAGDWPIRLKEWMIDSGMIDLTRSISAGTEPRE